MTISDKQYSKAMFGNKREQRRSINTASERGTMGVGFAEGGCYQGMFRVPLIGMKCFNATNSIRLENVIHFMYSTVGSRGCQGCLSPPQFPLDTLFTICFDDSVFI